MTRHRPRKQLGQHFLHDSTIITRITAGFKATADDFVVEIGPGKGALTGELLRSGATLHAIELDRDLCAWLTTQFADNDRFILHQADALTFDYCQLSTANRPLRLIGNLPYNISTPLMFHVLEESDCIRDMCFMLQKEVVDRIRAQPGGKDYGRLSVMMQYHCMVEKLLDVAPGAFNPPPRVKSSVIRLVPYTEPPVSVKDPKGFADVVRLAFSQRRKTLRNTLKPLINSDSIETLGIDAGRRAETLTLAEFAAIANTIADSRS